MNALVQNRSDFLDRIRVLLTALVILHHTAIMYGADGGWYLRYKASGVASALPLTLFCAINQSFFMGMFFLLAGYFSTRSLAHKGAWQFILDRLLRLGLPTLFFGFILGPLTIALAEAGPDQSWRALWWYLVTHLSFNIGPLWFAYALLIFSVIFVALRSLFPNFSWRVSGAVLQHRWIALFAVVWGLAAFILRLCVPTGQEIFKLQLGYFASYLLLFFFGCAAAQERVLEKIEKAVALPWGCISLLTIPSLFIYAILAGALRGVPFHTNGGWSMPAFAYAMWEPFVACGIMLLLLWHFRVASHVSSAWRAVAPLCYAAFIIHAPVVVALGVALKPLQQELGASSLLMFGITGLASVLLSFALAAVALKLPILKRIL